MSETAQSQLVWRSGDSGLTPALITGSRETRVAWAPLPGSQVAYLTCPVFEALIEGNRGGGKTDGFIMTFVQNTGRGYGGEWRGILFRRTYPELRDIIDKCLKWIPAVCPGAQYNRSEAYWTWPGGEQLFLRHLAKESDYWSYHGHNYPWMGFEELCTWPDDRAYTKMFSCARSAYKGIPIMVRATANPYGVGHNWVKRRFRLPLPPGRVRGMVMRNLLNSHGEPLPERVAIHSHLGENKILLDADPNYLSRIKAAAKNEAEYRAWVHGDWNIVAGGMFDDVWEPSIHVLPKIPLARLPRQWYINRAYDHGSSAPFSVGWWAESNGEPLIHGGRQYGSRRGDLIRVAEWYGWDGENPNTGLGMPPREIALGVLQREREWGLAGRVRQGPADTQIFDPNPGHPSIAQDMALAGVVWDRADKGPGSRVQGWTLMRQYLSQAAQQPRERPGLFVLETCDMFQQLVPALPRDERNMDDVDSDAEDHIGDETRYRVRQRRVIVETGAWK